MSKCEKHKYNSSLCKPAFLGTLNNNEYFRLSKPLPRRNILAGRSKHLGVELTFTRG